MHQTNGSAAHEPEPLLPHPDFEVFSVEELQAAVKELEQKISFGSKHGADHHMVVWLLQEKRSAEAELRRRNELRPQQNALWPEFLSAAQILALPPDPTRWRIDQFLPEGNSSVLVSKPKVGKTTFAVQEGLCVARGIPFMGRETRQAPVAYLSLDASLPEIAEVFIKLGLRDSDPVFMHAGAAPADALNWVVQSVKKNGVRFVVVDTLQRFFRFQDLNDYSAVTNTMEPLLEAMRQEGCHVQFLHHAKKDAGDDLDSAIGSTAIRGLAYGYIHIKRLPESDRRILRSDQRGGKNFAEVAIGFNRDGWLELKGTRDDAEIDDAKPKIQEFIESQDRPVREDEIQDAVKLRRLIMSKALREMFKDNQVERTGKGRKRDPFYYSLAGSLLKNENSVPDGGFQRGKIGEPNLEKERQVQAAIELFSVPKDAGTARERNGIE